MASQQIRMSPDTMRERALQTDRQAETMQNLISAMESLLNTLKAEWEGEAMKGYEDRYNQIKPVLKNANELLIEIAKNLRATANIVEQTDMQIASQYRGGSGS